MKIGVIGLYTNENIGDYLLFECAKSLIANKYDDVEFKDIDADPRGDFSLYKGKRRFNLEAYRIFTRYRDSKLFKHPYIGYFLSCRW